MRNVVLFVGAFGILAVSCGAGSDPNRPGNKDGKVHASPSTPPSFIDFHLHMFHDSADKLGAFLDLERGSFYQRQFSLILSDGYLGTTALDLPRADLLALHQQVSDFVATRPMLGLCGIQTHWDMAELEARTRDCLELPGMAGVKLREDVHLATCEEDQSHSPYEDMFPGLADDALDKIAAIVDEKYGVILIHFNYVGFQGVASDEALPTEDWGPCHEEESNSLIRIASGHPSTKFIIAHAGISSRIGPKGLQFIGAWYGSHPGTPRNIYADISAVAGNVLTTSGGSICPRVPPFDNGTCAATMQPLLNSKRAELMVAALREFDLDWVVYGSDRSDRPDGDLSPLDALRFIDDNRFLSMEEKEKILHKNGERMLETVRH